MINYVLRLNKGLYNMLRIYFVEKASCGVIVASFL